MFLQGVIVIQSCFPHAEITKGLSTSQYYIIIHYLQKKRDKQQVKPSKPTLQSSWKFPAGIGKNNHHFT